MLSLRMMKQQGEFYTSDEAAEYIIVAEGFTSEGEDKIIAYYCEVNFLPQSLWFPPFASLHNHTH